jgi:hypothetical protein
VAIKWKLDALSRGQRIYARRATSPQTISTLKRIANLAERLVAQAIDRLTKLEDRKRPPMTVQPHSIWFNDRFQVVRRAIERRYMSGERNGSSRPTNDAPPPS